MSDALWPHGLQHSRPPCPSPTPTVYSNSCPYESVMPSNHFILCRPLLFLPAFNLSQRQGLFQRVNFSHQVAQVLQLQYQSFQWIFRADFLEDGLVGFPFFPRDSQECSPTPQFKSINCSVLSFLYNPTHIQTWLLKKIIALTRRTFAGKIMPLLFHMLNWSY